MNIEKSNKMISLISGGIDSPVATYLMLKRGAEIATLYLDTRPFTDEKTKKKVIDLVNQLRKVTKKDIKLYVIPHGNNQKLFAQSCNRHVGCLLCRRMMYRLAAELAKREHASAIITGESLGQVASQTLQNIYVESQVISIPIIRPLIGLDKIEIEEISKEIGTYEISISPGLCCTIVPKKPSTNANLDRLKKEEENLDINSMILESFSKLEVL
jgi:thiamine biosynthesis protein ThiI